MEKRRPHYSLEDAIAQITVLGNGKVLIQFKERNDG